MSLSNRDLDRYQRDGFVKDVPICGKRELQQVMEQVNSLLDGLPSEQHRDRLLNLHLDHPFLLDLALHPVMLQCAKQLLGPDLALFNTRLMVKEPGAGRAVAWHQDVKYFPLEPPEVVTCWMALDRVTRENSPLLAVAGAHRQGVFPHVAIEDAGSGVFDEEIDPGSVNLSEFECLTVEAGDCILMEGHVPHASEANASPRRRTAFISRYISTKTRLNRSARPLYGESYPLLWISGSEGANHYVNRGRPPR